LIRTDRLNVSSIQVNLNLTYPVTFTDIHRELNTAAKLDLDLEGYNAKNNIDKAKERLTEFMDTGEVMNNALGYRIEDFWSKEDIILNVMDQPNDYIFSTLITDLLISLQRYYNSKPVHPSRLRTLVVIDECVRCLRH